MSFVLYTPSELSRRLAVRVRDLRLEQGLSQKELAERAGVAVPTYRHFERSGQISLERLASVVTVLGRADDFDSLLAPRTPDSIDAVLARQIKRRRAPFHRARPDSGTGRGGNKA